MNKKTTQDKLQMFNPFGKNKTQQNAFLEKCLQPPSQDKGNKASGGLPQVKILNQEMSSGAKKIQLLGTTTLVRLFDKYFQDEVDISMNKFEQQRKDSTITLSVFESFNQGSSTELQGQLAVISETINTLQNQKELIIENNTKDQIIRNGNKELLKMVEGDIAKSAIREFENGQNMLRFYVQENETFNVLNLKLQYENDQLKQIIEEQHQEKYQHQEQMEEANEQIDKLKRRLFNLKRQNQEIIQMQSNEAAAIYDNYNKMTEKYQKQKLTIFGLKENIKSLNEQLASKKQQVDFRLAKPTNLISILENSRIQSVLFQYLIPQQYMRISSTCSEIQDLVQRPFVLSMVQERSNEIDKSDDEKFTVNSYQPQYIVEEEKQCKACKEALRQITQLEQFKVKINTQMISNSQQALVKANDLVGYYAQFLPEDFFDNESEDEDQDDFTSKSVSAITGFFSKLMKTTFDDNRNTVQYGNNERDSTTSFGDDKEQDPLKFKSPEKVYEFLYTVIQSVMQDKTRLAALLKDIQQSYSQLFFYQHFLLDLSQSLIPVYSHYSEYQDVCQKAVSKLRSDNTRLQQKLQYESYQFKESLEKIRMLEARQLKQQAELVDHRIERQSLEKRVRQMSQEIKQLLEKLNLQQTQRTSALSELDTMKRERNFLNESLRELRAVFENIIKQ